MREHGVLNRLLLIYENKRDSLMKGADADASAITGAADLLRRFIDECHYSA